MTRLHYQTLANGTLLDVAVTAGVMTLRAGRSLRPDQRPEILQLTFADWVTLAQAGTDLFRSSADIIDQARAAVAAGGTHDCGEWRTSAGVCALCGEPVPPRDGSS